MVQYHAKGSCLSSANLGYEFRPKLDEPVGSVGLTEPDAAEPRLAQRRPFEIDAKRAAKHAAHYRCAAPAHHVVTRERWGSSPLDNDPRMHCDGATPAVGARRIYLHHRLMHLSRIRCQTGRLERRLIPRHGRRCMGGDANGKWC